MQQVTGVGPIPVGAYAIGKPFDSARTGPVVMRLTPLPGTVTYGRDDFELHGDSRDHPGAASHGCIILPRPLRERIGTGYCKLLVVLSGKPIDRRALIV